jgi:hypothetical protein
MSDAYDNFTRAIEEAHPADSAATRRQLVAGATGVIGGMGLLGVLTGEAKATHRRNHTGPNTVENIINIAATAEVLATIVNQVGSEQVNLDPTTQRNVRTAALQERIHYEVLVSNAVGARPLTKRIWVPDEVFANRDNFLTTLVVGDQIFINAYLLATTVFARPTTSAGSRLSRIAAEFMGVEAVHRALALQSLGRLGNDRAFMKFAQDEEAQGLPTTGQAGFFDITRAPAILQAFGFGFGEEGNKPGRFYEYDEVAPRVRDDDEVNTRSHRARRRVCDELDATRRVRRTRSPEGGRP